MVEEKKCILCGGLIIIDLSHCTSCGKIQSKDLKVRQKEFQEVIKSTISVGEGENEKEYKCFKIGPTKYIPFDGENLVVFSLDTKEDKIYKLSGD